MLWCDGETIVLLPSTALPSLKTMKTDITTVLERLQSSEDSQNRPLLPFTFLFLIIFLLAFHPELQGGIPGSCSRRQKPSRKQQKHEPINQQTQAKSKLIRAFELENRWTFMLQKRTHLYQRSCRDKIYFHDLRKLCSCHGKKSRGPRTPLAQALAQAPLAQGCIGSNTIGDFH